MNVRSAIVALTVLLSALCAGAQDVVILLNKNLPDCVEAAEATRKAAPSAGNPPANLPVIAVDGGTGDRAALGKLKTLAPKVVIATGAWATRLARETLPQAWVVHVLVPYPEVEGFTRDARMTGVSPLGLEKDLFAVANGMAPVKKLAVVHSEVISPFVEPLLGRLKKAGFEPTDFPLSEAPLLQEVMVKVKGRFQAVLLLPDPITDNPYALRFLVTQCVEAGILPLTLDRSLVGTGVLCGTFVKPETSGWQAASLAGKLPGSAGAQALPVVFLANSKVAVNLSTAQSLKLKVPSLPDAVIQ
jgi:ABC-type uncharacterized transport system substrate-binding protein